MSLSSDDNINSLAPLPAQNDSESPTSGDGSATTSVYPSGLARRSSTTLASLRDPRASMSIDISSTPTPQSDFYDDVLCGLTKTPKTISSKYLYDDRGSRLFHEICDLPEYYLTRSELRLTRERADDIAAQIGFRARLVELGVGRGIKTRLMLDSLHELESYIPVDISPKELQRCVGALRNEYPHLRITPLCEDYTSEFRLPHNGYEGRTAFYYPGSTIGNFSPAQAGTFLEGLSQMAGPRGAMVIGVDLDKDPAILHSAYNDSRGVTAAFNRNLLRRINRECNADFDLDTFHHHAVYQPDEHRIEMRLISTCAQTVNFPTSCIEFDAGEYIVTEHSHKYTIEDFALLCEESGWRTRSLWTDNRGFFSIWYLENTWRH